MSASARFNADAVSKLRFVGLLEEFRSNLAVTWNEGCKYQRIVRFESWKRPCGACYDESDAETGKGQCSEPDWSRRADWQSYMSYVHLASIDIDSAEDCVDVCEGEGDFAVTWRGVQTFATCRL